MRLGSEFMPAGLWPARGIRRRLIVVAVGVLGICGLPVTALSQDTWYVDADATGPVHDGTDWCTAFQLMQDAIAVAVAGDTILVAEGTYMPHASDSSQAFLLVPGITWRGGFAGCDSPLAEHNPAVYPTVLSGDLSQNDDVSSFPDGLTFVDNSDHVIQLAAGGAAATLEGFIISGGHAENELVGDAGGGVLVEGGHLVMRRCTLEWNHAGRGAAVHVSGGFLEVDGCTFLRNEAIRWGGAVDHFSCSSSIVNSVFLGNRTDGEGGAVHSDLSTVTATNTTMTMNTALNRGGGFFNYAGVELRGTNNILWLNTSIDGQTEAAQIFNNKSNLNVVNHSCVSGWTGKWGGEGNHGEAQGFVGQPSPGADMAWNGVDDDLGDLRLDAGSPCRNAGDNDADIDAAAPGLQPIPDHDIRGAVRIADGTVDMGAFEGASAGVPAQGVWGGIITMLGILALADVQFRRRHRRLE